MFSFKQFSIQQDRTAMKVCTDACVLGAYADVTGDEPVKRMLDIGTGTGLLALMAAQRNATALVDAVEIDESAFGQAQENVAASPFAQRVRVFHQRVQEFSVEHGQYDRILTNPPFYTNHLRSPDAAVNRALHTDDLPFAELIASVRQLLAARGQWWVLVPLYESQQLVGLAQKVGLKPFKQLFLRHHARKPAFRVITGYSFQADSCMEETLDIYEGDGRTYATPFRALLRDFYLIF